MKSLIKIKKGQIWESKVGNPPFQLRIAGRSGKGWGTVKLNGSNNNHHITDYTLNRHYKLIA